MSDEDWLNEPALAPVALVPYEGAPADAGRPGLSTEATEAAVAAQEQRQRFIVSWESLTDSQRVFLNTWRECRFNQARTLRVLANTQHGTSKTSVLRWSEIPQYEFVKKLLRSASVQEILNKDYLAARHEDIAETAMTPTPILHQGFATGHFEVDLGVAAKANETLLKLGGHLKDEKPELNVGIVGPSFVIQVVQPNGVVVDVTPRTVPVPELPEPDTEWLGVP